ncbi:MAG: type II toxin-antitoxin system YafQ family toxin [Gammaproteobacteria bacterium]|nr:type II toxin-antitoxin system YafQ family toxin [Gammaproteobacteria bacterium]
MRTIERTSRFKRDYKRESRGQHRTVLDDCLTDVVHALASDTAMDRRYHDHALSGSWADFRDCHLRPSLILIYQKPDPNTLRLVRLGSHSELGFG